MPYLRAYEGKPMRVHRVKRAAKPQGLCEVCLLTIQAGTAYNWIKSRYGPKRSRHAHCRPFRPSDLTSNDKLSELYAIQEAIEDDVGAWGILEQTDLSNLISALEDGAEAARGVAEQYRESAENIESGFGHATSQSEELASNGDEVDGWADELEQLSTGLEPAPEGDWPEDWDPVEWRDDIVSQITDVVGQLPL